MTNNFSDTEEGKKLIFLFWNTWNSSPILSAREELPKDTIDKAFAAGLKQGIFNAEVDSVPIIQKAYEDGQIKGRKDAPRLGTGEVSEWAQEIRRQERLRLKEEAEKILLFHLDIRKCPDPALICLDDVKRELAQLFEGDKNGK